MPSQGIQQKVARKVAREDTRAMADRPQASPADGEPCFEKEPCFETQHCQAADTPATRAAAVWLSRQLARPVGGRPAESGTAERGPASADAPPSIDLRGGSPLPAAGSHPQFVSSGFRSVDRLLPAGGLRRGSIVEWLADGDAAGAVTLAAAVACRLAAGVPTGAQGSPAPAAGTIVVVDRGARFHPPAILPWLSAPAAGAAHGGSAVRPQLVVVRPARDDDELWAIDQSLRCPGVAAVLAWPRRVHATAARRWQLAARASGAMAMLVRLDAGAIDAVRREPTWADARVAVAPADDDDVAAPGRPWANGLPHARDDVSGPRLARRPEVSAAGDNPGEPLPWPASVRWLRLVLVGGPWLGDVPPEEPAVELALDVDRGVESVRPRRERRERTGGGAAGGVACRAS